MFKRFAALAAVAIFCISIFVACYMKARYRTIYLPQTPDILYPVMKATLIELGYTITTDEPIPSSSFSPDPYMIGTKDKIKLMTIFKRIQAETHVEINASQIGPKTTDSILDKIRDETVELFNEKIKQLK